MTIFSYKQGYLTKKCIIPQTKPSELKSAFHIRNLDKTKKDGPEWAVNFTGMDDRKQKRM